MIPALADREVTVATPGPDPLDTLLTVFGSAAAEPGTPIAARVRAALAPRADATSPRLLVIDQFEEVFTTCADEAVRADFLSVLHECSTRADDPITIVLALRADFYAPCLNHPVLRDALEHRSYPLGPMGQDELAQAISGPARAVGLELEPGLEELVITELCGTADHHGRRTYDPGALPLLSHVMAATWQHRDGRRLTTAGYRKVGGVVGSVAETAEYAWNELTPGQQAAARTLLLGLVSVRRDARDTRRPALRPDLLSRAGNLEDATTALELLARTRLITLDADAVTLTHEIVLTAWPRLRTWIDEDRVGYLVRQRLETDAAEWAAQERDSSLLYQGTRLDNALGHVDPPAVGPLAQEFLATAEHARRKSRRRATWTKARLALLAAALLLVAFGAYSQTRLADQRRDDRDFAAVLAEANRVRSVDPSLAAQLNLVAWRMRPGDATAESQLLQTQNQPLMTATPLFTQAVREVAFGKGGTLLGALSYNGAFQLSDTSDPRHPKPLGKQLDGIFAFAFSPDGAVLATTPMPKTGATDTILWDISEPSVPRRSATLPTARPTTQIAFTPDGRTLVTVDSTDLTLWDTSNPSAPVMRSPRRLRSSPGTPYDQIRISPNGRVLSLLGLPTVMNSGGYDQATVQLWNIADRANPALLNPAVTEPGAIRETAFSPDSTLLAIGIGDGAMHPTGDNDATVQLWDIGDPVHPRRASTFGTALGEGLWALEFSPDGHTLAASSSRSAGLWNVTDPTAPSALGIPLSSSPGICHYDADTSTPCDSGPSSMAFAADGRTLVSGSWTGEVQAWSLPPAILDGHSAWVNPPVFDATGHRMAAMSSDGRITLWDRRDDRPPVLLGEYGTTPQFGFVQLSPDGNTLVLGTDSDRTAACSCGTSPTAPTPNALSPWRIHPAASGGSPSPPTPSRSSRAAQTAHFASGTSTHSTPSTASAHPPPRAGPKISGGATCPSSATVRPAPDPRNFLAPHRVASRWNQHRPGDRTGEMNAFNESVIEEFRAKQGKVGGAFEGRDNMVVITTTGAKSGRAVTNPLVYVPDTDRIVLIASNGGVDKHPAWYHNLRANPELTVELGTETYTGKAEFLSGAEADALYERMIDLMPVFAEYRAKTTRRIPVVAIYRA
ncbi:nitroreductase family deazaflavin-dependent oxidoreductase [Nocardia yunnanensis]|uniref:Nitroreductase family deazaflavin-dependent oxidoreductase n=1 Tax=Nocardia yunnanensis TaxID=2382165 RepID=A0A386ZDB7_9NOCA|nr:nitroreductase family deazaflavin-dependent oxidoreductase [Nocardia yunnanensis]